MKKFIIFVGVIALLGGCTSNTTTVEPVTTDTTVVDTPVVKTTIDTTSMDTIKIVD